MQVTEMTVDDYDQVRALWESSDGVGLDESDSREKIAFYLSRNAGLSVVVKENGVVVGAVLCGCDGRRGYLSHLAVAKSHQKKGVGKALIDSCLARLAELGISKCNARVYVDNEQALRFWRNRGWRHREDIIVMTISTDT